MKNTKKLTLRTQTLRTLRDVRSIDVADLQAVVGGLGGDEVGKKGAPTFVCH